MKIFIFLYQTGNRYNKQYTIDIAIKQDIYTLKKYNKTEDSGEEHGKQVST